MLVGQRLHVWIEFKQDQGRLTPAQKIVFPKLEAFGEVIIYAKRMTPTEVLAKVRYYRTVWSMM